MPDDNRIRPADVYRETGQWIGPALMIGLSLLGVGAVIVLCGWLIGGWFQSRDIQRNYSNTVSSQGYQASLLSQMQQHLANISGPDGLAVTRAGLPASSPEQQVIRAQELNELGALCAESTRFNARAVPGGQDMQAVITANCTAGTVIASPPLAPPAGG